MHKDIDNSARLFEGRIKDAFDALGYRDEKLVDFPEVDLFLSKFEFPVEIRILIELKYYERNLVSASTILKVINMLQQSNVDKAIIVTTLGFTRKAIELAEESNGKIVLMTEAELVENIPGRRMHESYKAFLMSNYVQSSVRDYYEIVEPSYEYIASRLPKNMLCELLSEFTSHEEIARLATAKIPKKIVIKQLARILKPAEVKEILEKIPRETAKPIPRKNEIDKKYKKAITASDANRKGKLLEQVMKDIFGSVRGLKITDSNVDDGIEEIDIQIRNYNHEHVWAEFEGMIFVECKNWSKPVGSKEIDSFKGKLERNGIHAGILVATNGVTGRPYRLEGALGAIKMYLQKGYRIVVLDGKDLEDILRCKDVSEKVDEKYVHLYKIGSKQAQELSSTQS